MWTWKLADWSEARSTKTFMGLFSELSTDQGNTAHELITPFDSCPLNDSRVDNGGCGELPALHLL